MYLCPKTKECVRHMVTFSRINWLIYVCSSDLDPQIQMTIARRRRRGCSTLQHGDISDPIVLGTTPLPSRGVTIPLFPRSRSGIGIAKKLTIQLCIQIREWNHNTFTAVTNPLFPGSRFRIRIAFKSRKELKSDSGAGSRARIVTPLLPSFFPSHVICFCHHLSDTCEKRQQETVPTIPEDRC